MTTYYDQHGDRSLTLDSVLRFMRVAGAGLGMLTIVIGLVSATRVFTLVYDALEDPDGVRERVEAWAIAVGGQQLDFVIEGNTVPGAHILAVITLGGAVVLLTGLSLGLIKVGTATLYKTLTDRDAVRQLLEKAFGPDRKPGVSSPSPPPPTPEPGRVDHHGY